MTARDAYPEIEKVVILEQRVEWLIFLIEENSKLTTNQELTYARNVKEGISTVLDAPIKDFCERSTSNLLKVRKLVEDEIASIEKRIEESKEC
jgi:hypothetical protein